MNGGRYEKSLVILQIFNIRLCNFEEDFDENETLFKRKENSFYILLYWKYKFLRIFVMRKEEYGEKRIFHKRKGQKMKWLRLYLLTITIQGTECY